LAPELAKQGMTTNLMAPAGRRAAGPPNAS
jgi:hypothetical protein